jgi:hypothetical protein
MRGLEDDRKKALRLKEAKEKTAQKEMEKLQRSLEKTNMRGKKKMNPILSQKVKLLFLQPRLMILDLKLLLSTEVQNGIPHTTS